MTATAEQAAGAATEARARLAATNGHPAPIGFDPLATASTIP